VAQGKNGGRVRCQGAQVGWGVGPGQGGCKTRTAHVKVSGVEGGAGMPMAQWGVVNAWCLRKAVS